MLRLQGVEVENECEKEAVKREVVGMMKEEWKSEDVPPSLPTGRQH